MSVRIVIVYHSGSGHTAAQARAVLRGAQSVDEAVAQLISVTEVEDHWSDLDAADAIIFGAPTYMGSPSAAFKTFAEATAKIWADNMRWKDKIAAGFTNSQNMNGDKLNTLVSMAILAAQHGMQWVSLGLFPGWNTSTKSIDDLNRMGSFLGAMAQSHGDLDADQAPTTSDLKTAEYLGRRVALVTQQWVNGRQASESNEYSRCA